METVETKQHGKIIGSDFLELLRKVVIDIHPDAPVPPSAISLDSAFDEELGLDSLSRVELISRVESAFKISLPDRTFAEVQTPRDLLRVLMSLKPTFAVASPAPAITETTLINELPDHVATLNELLDWHALRHPDRLHIQIYQDDGNGEKITYRALKNGAEKIAASLQQYGLGKGEPVAIMLPTGVDYFYTFFGILLAGAIPVPIYPPARPSQLEEHMRRHVKILENCRAPVLITVSEAKQVAHLLKSLVPTVKHIVTARELQSHAPLSVLPRLNPQDIAFLQYTSGSTGDPKGVILTHMNLLANIRAMGKAVNATSQDVFVSWLPLYHDMGLIGAWLGSLYYGALFVVMPPLSFLAKPERWLRAIERHKGTLSASPNFGYEYVMHRLGESDMGGLDLSSWRAAFNGAEAVIPETLERFASRFAPYGFKKESMMPVYGLAESSVGLAFPPLRRPPLIDRIDRDTFIRSQIAVEAKESDPHPLRFVSSGVPLSAHQIRIVDPLGNELPERHEGRLEFTGPSSTSGYYRDAGKTRALFDREWLDSGDLAYIAGGELFVTGRIKDIIIRAGHNIYPDELEKMIGEIPGIRKGCVAVFGSVDPQSATERLIVLAESRSHNPDELTRLRLRVNELSTDLLGTPPDVIVLAPPGSVLKTSSGKIRRSASRKMYEEGRIGTKSKGVIWQIVLLVLRSALPQSRRFLSYLKASAYALYCWGLFTLLSAAAWCGAVFLPTLRLRWKIVHGCARLLVKATRTPFTVIGGENLPLAQTPCVMVANHASYLDTLILAAVLNEPVRFVAKSELSHHLLTRLPLQRLNAEFVERFDIGKSIDDVRHLFDLLEENNPFLFFPEGTFTRIPGLQPFHMGAFKAAADAGLPLVPIAIRGSRSMLRGDSWFPRAGSITITIGAPIDLAETADQKDKWDLAVTLKERARDFILQHCGEPDLLH